MNKEFLHNALTLESDRPLIYTAMSKHYFYYRMFISKYVLEQGGVPLNPFMIFDYFLLDSIDRKLVVEGNNNLVKRADAIWVFGPVSDGVLAEIIIASARQKEIRYFEILKPHEIVPVSVDNVTMEDDVKEYLHLLRKQ